jgi:choline kinase
MVTEAVILAAGMGSRMNTGGTDTLILKPFIDVGGQPIIRRNLGILQACGIGRVTVVTGFHGDDVQAGVRALGVAGLEIGFVQNDEWRKSNGISLLKTRGVTSGPFVLLMGDHLMERAIVEGLLAADHGDFGAVLAVDRKIAQVFDLDDATRVRTSGRRIEEIGKSIDPYDAVDCGVFLCSQEVYGALEAGLHDGDVSLSDGVRVLARAGRFLAHDIGAARWQDVDTPDMLGEAARLFK